jgi:hypothetical protein
VPRLVEVASFQAVTGEVVARTLHFPSPEEFIQRNVAGSPLSVTLAAVDDAPRAAVVADVSKALEPYGDAEGMACPMAAPIVTARR